MGDSKVNVMSISMLEALHTAFDEAGWTPQPIRQQKC
jgi:hypothetical protein